MDQPPSSNDQKFSTLRSPKASSSPNISDQQMSSLLNTLLASPLHGSEAIKEAAHILLIQLCNFLQTFPSSEGIHILSSEVDEGDIESAPLFYIYNDFALFSLSELQNLPEGQTGARLMLRDCTGRYAWDSIQRHCTYQPEIETYSLISNQVDDPLQIETIVPKSAGRKASQIPFTPIELEQKNAQNVDQFDELLSYLSETFPDCLIDNNRLLNEPVQLRPEFQSEIDKIQKDLGRQIELDKEGIDSRVVQLSSTFENRIPLPPQSCVSTSKYQACRKLLSDLGFLEYENLASSRFYMVEDSQRFRRSLTQLDRTSGREMSKIGVIYVKEGQDDQKIILKNDTKSPLYAEFVRGLGWPIDVATHQGYIGGLDRKLSTGKTAPYFANYLFEVAFHEITSMPTNPTDNQQIHKKRHVGNDIVHIVYTEHTSDYRPTTITSQFNDAHIVVYPLPNGLFRIQIYRKEKVPLFGPLVHGMCISKTLLPTLVRLTAIAANRTVRFNTGGYCRPFPTR